jgi:hypothetical protein
MLVVVSVDSVGAPGEVIVGVIVELAQVLTGVLVTLPICQVPLIALQIW